MSAPAPSVVAAVDAPVDDRTFHAQMRKYMVELRAACRRISDLETQLKSEKHNLSRMLDDSASGLADADRGEVVTVLRCVSDGIRP